MAKVISNAGGPGGGKDGKSKNVSKKIRTNDDLEVLRIILEENPGLKAKVERFLVRSLGKNSGTASDESK